MDRITREFHQAMAHATDYQTWLAAAEELDLRDGLEEWKDDEISDDYDWRLIRSRLRQVRQFRTAKDIPRLVYHLRQGLHWNLGNTGNPKLYSVLPGRHQAPDPRIRHRNLRRADRAVRQRSR